MRRYFIFSAQIAEEESGKKFKPLRVKKMYVLAAQLVMQQNVKMAEAMKDGEYGS